MIINYEIFLENNEISILKIYKILNQIHIYFIIGKKLRFFLNMHFSLQNYHMRNYYLKKKHNFLIKL